MAGWGVKIRSTSVLPHLDLIRPNMRAALDNGVHEVVSKSVDRMVKTARAAHTRTGRMRVAGETPNWQVRPAWYQGRGPGREESGALIRSMRWLSESPNAGYGPVKATAGFINPPRYAAEQELGTTGEVIDGRPVAGIPPMLAYSAGHARAAALFQPVMNRNAEMALRAAAVGRRTRSHL